MTRFNWDLGGTNLGLVDAVAAQHKTQVDKLERTFQDKHSSDEARDLELVLTYNTAFARLMRDLTARPDIAHTIKSALDTGVRMGIVATIIALKEEKINFDWLKIVEPEKISPNYESDPLSKYKKHVEKEFEDADVADSSRERTNSIREREEALGLHDEGESNPKRKRGDELARIIREHKATGKKESESEQPEVQSEGASQNQQEPESGDASDSGASPDGDSADSNGSSDS